MHLLSNDRWRAVLELPRVGRRRFAAESWLNPYASFARDLAAKRDAGQDVTLETREGAALIRAATFRTNGQIGAALEQFVDAFEHLTAANRVRVLLASETLEAMHRADERKSLVRSREYVIGCAFCELA